MPRMTHGNACQGRQTKTYGAWVDMRKRCLRPENKRFHRYGGRGIKICDRWNEFQAFLEDMGEAPHGLTLDRIDNDGNYEPTNCRWATESEQRRNTSRTRFLEHNGERLCVSDWAERVGILPNTVRDRLNRGWTPERALTTPIRATAPSKRPGA